MHCPYCKGELEDISLGTASGDRLSAKRCQQCGGFWFDGGLKEPLDMESVQELESPQPNYSLQNQDLLCPKDQLYLDATNQAGQNGSQFYRCNECGGQFFPRGQLAYFTNWQQQTTVKQPKPTIAKRKQAAIGLALVFTLVVAILTTLSKGNLALTYQAATNQPLPTTGPNLLTLTLLAVTYLAGTVLAVLGRRLPVIIIGWCVIIICLFGFSVLIFSS